MKRLGWCAGLVAAAMLMGSACAQDWAKARLDQSPRHGEYVTLTEASGRKVQAWVVYPQVSGKAPVVVMVHEIFGLSDWAREMADEIAGAGYIVVVPDLLSGLGPATGAVVNAQPNTQVPMAIHPPAGVDPGMAVKAPCVKTPCQEQAAKDTQAKEHKKGQNTGAAYVPMMPGGTSAFPDQSAVVRAVSNLPSAQVMGDLDAAADYGKKLPSANGKLFVAGFCWGGGQSFLFATHRHDLSAAFVFYGTPPPVEAMKTINAPVYGFYAGNDARVTATVPQTVIDMKAAGKMYEPKIYDGAGHGFMRAGEAPDASAANTAARVAGFHRLIGLLGGIR